MIKDFVKGNPGFCLKFRITLLVLISINTFKVYAQSGSNEPSVPSFEQIVSIPKSPEAFAFQRYGNASVSYFNGSPDVSVPIGELSGRDISLPILLTYDASGIKVDQIASEVGLGWNLKVGGMIVRQVNGLPDDYSSATPLYYPYYSTSNYPGSVSVFVQYNHFINNNLSNGSYSTRITTGTNNWEQEWPVRYLRYVEEVGKGNIDSQPDTYSLNINGLSATLVIDYNTSTGYAIDNPEIKVYPTLNSGSNGVKQIASWQIIDGDGNVYIFGGGNAMETTQYYENNSAEVNRTYTSSWKIASITTGKLKEGITFNYTPESWTNDQPIVSYYSIDAPVTVNCSSLSTTPNLNPFYKISSGVLSSIKFNAESGNRLVISRGGSRSDLPGQTAITQLRINDEYGVAKSYVKFNTSYFSTGTSHLQKRLKLNSVAFHGDNATSANPQTYSFTYNSTDLPSRDSKARDYYGYYNGANSNTTLLPYNASLGNGAFRDVNASYTQAGILTEMTYPTKGSTKFFYQPNKEYSYSTGASWQTAFSYTWTSGSPEAYCDDIVGTTLNVQYQTFTAPVTGSYKINFTKNVDENSEVQLVALYKGTKTLCELVWENGPDIIYKQYSQANNQETYVTLEANTVYKVAMANNTNQNATMFISVAYLQSSSLPEFKNSAGLRIQKIEDYAYTGQLANRRYFYYNDGSGLGGQAIIDLVNSGTYISSGINQSAGYFEKSQTRETYVPGSGYQECIYLERSGTSFMNGNGRNFTYGKVSELSTDGNGEYHLKVFEFQNPVEVTEGPFISSSPLLGKMTSEKKYIYESINGSFNLAQETNHTYEVKYLSPLSSPIKALHFFSVDLEYQNYILSVVGTGGSAVTWGYDIMQIAEGNPQGCNLYAPNGGSFVYCISSGPLPQKYQLVIGGYRRQFLQLKETTTKQYEKTSALASTRTYSYDESSNFQVSEINQTNSNGELIKDVFSFPTASNNSALFNQNRLKELTKSQRFVNNVIKVEKTVYFSSYTGGRVLMQRVEEKMNGGAASNLITVASYDNLGNIQEIKQRDGIPITMVWGYLGTKPVLKVTGATYSQVLSGLGGSITLSDAGKNFTQAQISSLRTNLSSGLVNHFIFGSHHGLTRSSDQNGLNTDFSYDGFGRLKEVRDHDNNVLESYSFNIKN